MTSMCWFRRPDILSLSCLGPSFAYFVCRAWCWVSFARFFLVILAARALWSFIGIRCLVTFGGSAGGGIVGGGTILSGASRVSTTFGCGAWTGLPSSVFAGFSAPFTLLCFALNLGLVDNVLSVFSIATYTPLILGVLF